MPDESLLLELGDVFGHGTAGQGGVLNYRHNHIGLEIAYIHCFKTNEQRVKRLIMKSGK